MSTLIVIAKEPIPGRVKTRLTPPFTPQEAAQLAEAALVDTLRAASETTADHRLLVLQGEPGPWLPEQFTVVPQVSGTLDMRIAAAFQEAAKIDAGPALLIGMDTPQVDPKVLEEAFAAMGCANTPYPAPATRQTANGQPPTVPSPRLAPTSRPVPVSHQSATAHAAPPSPLATTHPTPTTSHLAPVPHPTITAHLAPSSPLAAPSHPTPSHPTPVPHATATGHAALPSPLTTPDQPTPPPHPAIVSSLAPAPLDAVFGPAEDGGFWALGLRDPAHLRVAGLLLGVPMSQPETGRIQLGRLIDAGLRVELLPSLRDIDTAPDAYAAAGLAPGGLFARRLASLSPVSWNGPAQANAWPTPAATVAVAPASWNGPVSASYERALWLTLSQDVGCLPILLEGEDGESVELDVARYAAAPDAADTALLDRCTGPTLDIGCGPGRLSAELARRGIPSLGVDVAPVALLLARAAGATTLRRSVFDPLPGEGRWPHALLIDGNIGIGGDPAALLARVKALLMPTGGELVVETASEDVDERHRLRVDGRGTALPWARLGTAALRGVAEQLGYVVSAQWQSQDRHFVALTT
jgi:glycosyltransferase A (GT-A) superfamily protein (DUF2064 family)/SAM-dependent methyltransferase